MIKEYNNKSLAFGIPGLILQIVGLFISPLVSLVGTILLIIGLGLYSKAKGYSIYFGLFGLISFLGMIVLIALKDKHLTPEELEHKKQTKPKDVFWGIVFGVGLVIGIPILLFLAIAIFTK